jgi:hypothetical protein
MRGCPGRGAQRLRSAARSESLAERKQDLLSIPINGLVIVTTWGWFIVPIFDVREIGLAEAVGLSIFASIISQPRPGEKRRAA